MEMCVRANHTDTDERRLQCELTVCCWRKCHQLLSHREVAMVKEWQRVALLIVYSPKICVIQVKKMLHNQDMQQRFLKGQIQDNDVIFTSTLQTLFYMWRPYN